MLQYAKKVEQIFLKLLELIKFTLVSNHSPTDQRQNCLSKNCHMLGYKPFAEKKISWGIEVSLNF
jgi:hypothetical protein